MVQFNIVQIAANNANIRINAEILAGSAYTDSYISRIAIDTNTTYLTTGESLTPVYEEDFASGTKTIDLTILSASITEGIEKKLFVVYIYTKSIETDEALTTQTQCIYNRVFFYRKALIYLSELNSACDIPMNFVNYYLQEQSIDFSIKIGNYYKAITLFNKFILIS